MCTAPAPASPWGTSRNAKTRSQAEMKCVKMTTWQFKTSYLRDVIEAHENNGGEDEDGGGDE